jgi:PPOX class probable F420-dependent enzyme
MTQRGGYVGAALPEKAKELLETPEFAIVATIGSDGQPQMSVVWVKHDGDDVLISTTTNRQKYRNISRDPRVSVLVYPTDRPYSYLEVRGHATMTEEGGRELIDEFNEKYHGVRPYPGDVGTDNVRVVVRITPDKVVYHGR